MSDVRSIARLIDALAPWREHLVVVGGWAHRLHRYLPGAILPPYEPLQTKDADVAFSATAALKGDISKALKQAGYREEFSGEHKPPVTWYRLGDEDNGFYVEFLSPLSGSRSRRDGTADATTTTAGVSAQKLRHLELLLIEPNSVDLGRGGGIPDEKASSVQVANPVSFIAQKLLIRTQRTPEKQAQDALYIHDTLELFAGELDAMRAVWIDRLRPHIHRRTVAEIEELSRNQFAKTTDVIRNAARIAPGRALVADNVRAACEYGLSEIFR